MAARPTNLWTLVQGSPEVDPERLATAIEKEASQGELDYRTRLLIRDSLEALRTFWGARRLECRLGESPIRTRLEAIAAESFDAPGFPSLSERLVDHTDPETIKQYFRELGSALAQPLQLDVGGSVALMLPGYLSRHTEDIDVVDEVPADIRSRHALLNELRKRYGLNLAHFQSHYLPTGWQTRLRFLDQFQHLNVRLVDVYDIFLCKLFSRRTKDLDDLRALAPQLERDRLTRLLKETTTALRRDETLRQQAEHNWYILYGESLPV